MGAKKIQQAGLLRDCESVPVADLKIGVGALNSSHLMESCGF